MSWEQYLSQAGIAVAEIAGATIMNVSSGGTIKPSLFGAVLQSGAPAIMGLFGLGNSGTSGSTPDYKPYFNAIQNQLSGLETAVLQNLSDIQYSINWIQAGITTIEMDIQDSELQNLLLAYNENKNVITPLMGQYANALGALGTGSDDQTTTQTMFNLLSDNASAVATAMLNIYIAVYGQDELKGILDFQVEVCESAMTSWASAANLQSYPGKNQNTVGYGVGGSFPPWCYDCSQLLTVPLAQVLPQAIVESIVPTFQAILNSMGQGLMFLGAAWQNTNNDNQLAQHISNVRAVVQKMNGFWTVLSNAAAVDAFMCNLVNSYKQVCGDLGQWIDVSTNPDNTTPATQPFSNDWVYWFVPAGQGNQEIWPQVRSAVVNLGPTVNTLGGTYPAYLLGTGMGEGPTGNICASTTATIPAPASLTPSAPPAALTAFLNAVQGAVVPSVIVAYPGMAALGLVSSVLGQPPTTAAWSIQPSDGSAGTVTSQAGSLANATYTAPATVAAPLIASVAVTLNGSVTMYVPIVLLPMQPTITVTPTATQVTPPTPVSFAASVAGCDWTLVPAGIGSIDGNGNYTPPASVTSPTSVLVVASTLSPARTGFACVQVTPSS